MGSKYRPRRTRIYDANFGIGESYYKKQLEDIDNKRGSSRFTDQSYSVPPIVKDDKLYSHNEDKLVPKVSFLADLEDEDLFQNRIKSLKNKSILDDFDENPTSSYRSLRASTIEKSDGIKSSERISKSFIKKSFDATDINKTSFVTDDRKKINDDSILKQIKSRKDNIVLRDSDRDDNVSLRVNATKARLADLESEMFSITQKQVEREKRNQSLKRLLNESDTF